MSEESDRARLTEGLGRALRRPWRLNQATRLSIDSLAQRYAGARGLAYEATGETPPATWFLETLTASKSHSFLRETLSGGAAGVLFYGERPIRLKRGEVMQGWTVALCHLPQATRLAYGVACVFRPSAALGGRLELSVGVPRGLTEIRLRQVQAQDRARAGCLRRAGRSHRRAGRRGGGLETHL